MKILLITTSEIEIEGLSGKLDFSYNYEEPFTSVYFGGSSVDFVLCDPGIFSMTYFLTRQLYVKDYQLVINAGICGSYKKDLIPGRVFRVTTDRFTDIGVRENGGFKDLFQMGLLKSNAFPFQDGIISDSPGQFMEYFQKIPTARAQTVNMMPYNKSETGSKNIEYKPELETMEGAAFFYVCASERMNFVQLRAVSNYTRERDKTHWKINRALDALSEVLKDFFYEIP